MVRLRGALSMIRATMNRQHGKGVSPGGLPGILRRIAAGLALPLLVAACGTSDLRTADPAEIARAAYVHDAPPSVTLLTVVNSSSGSGDHSALIINGSQRILYDPAGSFHHPQVVQHLDVHYGFHPRVEDVYMDYHARESHHVITQKLEVAPGVAEAALRAALAESKARPGQCAIKTTAVLNAAGLDVRSSVWPRTVMNDFARRQGLVTTILVEPGQNPSVLGLDPEFAANARRVAAPTGTYTPLERVQEASRAATTGVAAPGW